MATFFKNSGKAMVAACTTPARAWRVSPRAQPELLKFATKPLAGRVLPVDGRHDRARDLSAYRQGIEAEVSADPALADGVLSGGWYSGLSSLSRKPRQPAATVLPGRPGRGANRHDAVCGLVRQGARRCPGRRPALTFGASQGLIEYATRLIPVTKLGDLKAGALLLRMLANQIAAEIPGEQVATILQDLERVGGDRRQRGQDLRRLPGRAPECRGANPDRHDRGARLGRPRSSGIDAAMRRVIGEQRQASRPRPWRSDWPNWAVSPRAAALTQTSPETFQQFVEQATEDGRSRMCSSTPTC